RSSIVPQSTRPIEIEPYNESVSVRNGSVRAVSAITDPYHEERYVQEMPPPQISYRRVAEAPRKVMMDARHASESQLDTRQFQRSASVQVVDYQAARQSVFHDTHVAPRETLRMSSVRPTVTRYEEAPELVQRVQSVRPE